MIRSVVVEIAPLLRPEAGGLGRKRLLGGLARLQEVHRSLTEGAPAARWPHLARPGGAGLAEARAIGDGLGDRMLVVVGQPGAVGALRAVVEGAPREPLWVLHPSDPRLSALLGRPDVAWLVLEGPLWADGIAERAVDASHPVTVAGAGAHPAPPGGWWVSDPVAGDGRFAPLGAAAAVCASWCGVDVEALHAGATDMQAACARAALFENPAYTLALATVYAGIDLGATGPTHVVASGALGGFAEWAARLQSAVLSGRVETAGVLRHVGASGVSGIVGDEELLEGLLLGRRDRFVTLWEPVEGAGDPGGAEGLALSTAFRTLLDRERVPLVRIRLPGLDARSRGAALFLAMHATVAAAAFAELDPLALAAVEAWYAAVARALPGDEAAPEEG